MKVFETFNASIFNMRFSNVVFHTQKKGSETNIVEIN